MIDSVKMMLAARLAAYGREFTLDRVPVPEAPPGGALVRVAGAGVCRSDIDVRHGKRQIAGQFPCILGHENAGYVEAMGAGRGRFDVGEPVAVFGGWGCGECWWCRHGREHLCDLQYRCGAGKPGGFAEFLAVPDAQYLVPLGDLDPVWAAPLADAGLTSYRAVRKVSPMLSAGSFAVIVGIGGLGQFALQYLRLLTEATIAAVDVREQGRQRAKELGADIVVSGNDLDDTRDEIIGHTKGESVVAVLDFVGSNETLKLASRICGRQGAIVLVGLAGGSLEFRYDGLPPETQLMTSSWGSLRELEDVVDLARAGEIGTTVETHPLSRINEVFRALEGGDIRGRAVLTP